MKRRQLLLAATALAAPAFAAPALAQRVPPGRVLVRLHTELGGILLELDGIRAPLTVANFLRYVDRNWYTHGVFHRTVRMDNQPDKNVKIEVIQAGPDPTRGEPPFAPVPLERTSLTGIKHVDGTVSMARQGPDTATADFFICVGDQPELDFGGARNPDGQGFGAFGQVVTGMDVVRRIHQSAAAGQWLTPPIALHRVSRVRSSF